jgi:hypothetical protein
LAGLPEETQTTRARRFRRREARENPVTR